MEFTDFKYVEKIPSPRIGSERTISVGNNVSAEAVDFSSLTVITGCIKMGLNFLLI